MATQEETGLAFRRSPKECPRRCEGTSACTPGIRICASPSLYLALTVQPQCFECLPALVSTFRFVFVPLPGRRAAAVAFVSSRPAERRLALFTGGHGLHVGPSLPTSNLATFAAAGQPKEPFSVSTTVHQCAPISAWSTADRLPH